MHCPVRLLKGCKVNIGLSRVRALPLAAGSNEGGHSFWYFKSCPRVLKLWIRQKISAHVDAGLSGGSRVRRPGIEDIYLRS